MYINRVCHYISCDPLQVDTSPIHDLISNKLSEMTSDVANGKFIVCLYKFYPQFSDQYVITVVLWPHSE